MIEALFKRALGETRGLELYYRLYDRSGLALFLLIAAVAAAIWALVFSPDKYVHDGYLLADVVFTNSSSSEHSSFIFTAVVALPDGGTATVRTRVMGVASQTVDTACLERRREEDGDVFYRLIGQGKCQGLSSGQ